MVFFMRQIARMAVEEDAFQPLEKSFDMHAKMLDEKERLILPVCTDSTGVELKQEEALVSDKLSVKYSLKIPSKIYHKTRAFQSSTSW